MRPRPLVWALALLLALTANASAQRSAPPPTADTVGAPVVLMGDTLFVLHGSLGPFSAAERAAAAGARVRQWIEGRGGNTDSLRVVAQSTYSEIVAGDLMLFTVMDADARASGRDRAALAAEYARVVQNAGRDMGQQLSARGLGLALLLLLLATAVLAAALRIMSVVFPRVYDRVDALKHEKRVSLRIQRYELLSATRVAEALMLASQVTRAVLTVVLLYFYVPLVLSFFPWTRPLSRRIVGYALTPLAAAGSAFVNYLPNVFYIAVIVVALQIVLRIIAAVFRAIGDGSIRLKGFHREWAAPTYKIVRVFVLAFGIIVVWPYLPGAHTDAFKGVSIFLGVLLSFGSSSAVSNVMAGVVLTYTRAFAVGDRVRIGDVTGDVTEATLLATRVKTIKNELVTIPSSLVLGGVVTNYTRLANDSGGILLHTTVTIGYDTPWRQVEGLLIAAARRTTGVNEHPAPFVLQTRLDDFYVAYEINASTNRPDLSAATYSALHANIQDAFAEAGVEIMSPHYRAQRDGNAPALPAK